MGKAFFCVILAATGAASLAGVEAGPASLAQYAFDAGRGDALVDCSGNGYDGRIVGAHWEQREGRPCLVFDGAGDYVALGEIPGLASPRDFTILTWLRLEASPYPDDTTNWTVVDCEEYRKSGFLFRIDGGTGKPTFRASQEGTDQYGMSATALANGVTYFVVACRRGNQGEIYVNGRRDAQFPFNAPAPASIPLRISAPDQSFEGAVFELALFDRALSQEEVVNAYWRGAERYAPGGERGKIYVVPHVYEKEREVFAEVDYFGVLPLKEGETLEVSLIRADANVIAAATLAVDAGAGWAETRFDLNGLPAGRYSVRAALKSAERAVQAAVEFDYPLAAKPIPAPEEWQAGPLPAPAPIPAFDVRTQPGGGFVLAVGGHEYPVESAYSVPGGGWNTLVPGAPNAANEWQITTLPDGPVSASGKQYALSRSLTVARERLLVKDTLRNTGEAPLGLLIRHRVGVGPEMDASVYVGGRRATGPVPARSINRSPTLLAARVGEGIGLVPVDDVFLVQSRGAYDSQGRLELSTDEFALEAGASYTLEWALYVNGTGGYFDLVNAIRRAEERNNATIDGALAFLQGTQQRRDVSLVPEAEYFEMRNARYATVFCLSWCADDPAISVEGIEFMEYPQERARIRAMMEKLEAVRPDVKGMFHVAHQLYATNKPDLLFPDSRVLDAAGKQVTYPYNYENGSYFSLERYNDNWRWWIFYPTMENSFGKALLQSVDIMMDDMKTRGVFADGFFWGYGGEYTYDRWDGHSADIDPATHALTRKKGSVLLLSQDVMIAWCDKIRSKGGIVIANGVVPTRTICAQPILFDKEVTEGPEVPLLPTPITLGDPAICGTEAGAYRDVLNKLRAGNLYAYYNEPIKLSAPSLPQQMYPITVQEVQAGCVMGKERIITMNNGVYGWPGSPDLHFVYYYDSRGRETPHDFVSTVAAGAVRTEVVLGRDATAAIVRIPIRIQTTSPVNVIVRAYAGAQVHMTLNGMGDVEVVLPNEVRVPLRLNGVTEFCWPEKRSDGDNIC